MGYKKLFSTFHEKYEPAKKTQVKKIKRTKIKDIDLIEKISEFV
jgi:hypothetical protein